MDLFDDAIQIPKPTTKELLYATLKKCEADLELFALATNVVEVKKQYEDGARELSEALQSLRSKLKR